MPDQSGSSDLPIQISKSQTVIASGLLRRLRSSMTENMPSHCRGGGDQALMPDYHG
jgi:hypothetical protein